MLTEKKGEEALTDIRDWGSRSAKRMDETVNVDPYYDGESRTYVLRLVKGARILLFRLSEAQVHDPAGKRNASGPCSATSKIFGI